MIRSAIQFVTMALLLCLAAWLTVGCSAQRYAERVMDQGSPSQPSADAPSTPNRTAAQLLPSQSLPSQDEEVWVIARPPEQRTPPHSDTPLPGEGRLFASQTISGGRTLVPILLKHTDVNASIVGCIASVDVKQQYQNTFDRKIDALYVFPLPQNAAVHDFVMTIGSRRIRGIIRERHEAEQIYREARSQGYVASMLTQDRPNVFTQTVANIEPGKPIDVDIRYFNTLTYTDGGYDFVFPMIVGARFDPPGFAPPTVSQTSSLTPGRRDGHDISLSVDVESGVPIANIESRNHKIQTQQRSPTCTRVTLDPADEIANRDFSLHFQVVGDSINSAMLAQQNGSGGFFTLMLYPPRLLKDLPRQPLELLVVTDVSTREPNVPLDRVKAATRYAVTHLEPADTFQIIHLGNTAERLFPSPQLATPQAVREALQWIKGFNASKGAPRIDGLQAALSIPHDPNRMRCVAFITDGVLGNDAEALAEIHRSLGPTRVFCFGVGQSTNRSVFDALARMGRGAVAYLGPDDDAESIMAGYFDRITRPALTDISIDWCGARIQDVFPQQSQDLYVGRPVVLTGRFEGDLPKSILLRAKTAGRDQQIPIPVTSVTTSVDPKALPAVWARMKIANLAERASDESAVALPAQIRQLAMEYNLMSAYTAFIAVDSMTRTTGDHTSSVDVVAPPPQRVLATGTSR